jgi:hypothetical protein
MTDLIKKLLPRIQSHQFESLDFDADFIYPAYDGLSILNIPSTLCSLFGIPTLGAPPLIPEILSPLGDDIQHIILILMDALSLHRFKRWMLEGKIPVWKTCLKDGLLAPLTSIMPSTTTSAMTTLWSGSSTTEHGIAGYELWLKEYGIVANMILQSPMSFRGARGSIEQTGFQPENALTVPTLGPHFLQHGITPFSFQHYSISNSGLSRTYLKDVSLEPFGSAAELWVGLRQLIEARKNLKTYAWVYWGTVDGLSHLFGPDDERPEAEFVSFSSSFERNFLNKLGRENRKNTLVILTSDHGQIYTPKKGKYDLRYHPQLLDLLHIQPTGESRFVFLYTRPGQKGAVREYIEGTWPVDFIVRESKAILDSGLLGPGIPTPELSDRLGDLTILAKKDAYLWWAPIENPLLGRHGGLTPEDMLVPFQAVRL